MSLVALSAAYGAGGRHVGEALAERLGVPFLDRAIPASVAMKLDVPLDDAEAYDERISANWLERLLAGFVGGEVAAPIPLPSGASSAADFRRATEEILLRQAASGHGVILGRAAAIVLRDDPRVLRARLSGPPERRVRQAMRLAQLDHATAQRLQHRLDYTHAAYAKHFYGISLDDPSLYHVVLDSTRIAIDRCVEILEVATESIADVAV
jgi:cytidylate kinase